MNTVNKYLLGVLTLSGVIPLVCTVTELYYFHGQSAIPVFAQWFLFSAIGLRLFIAGLVQLFRPSYTLHTIFKIQDTKSAALVQELGVHNVLLGAFALFTPALPHYAYIAALMGGIYFGAAGLLHAMRKEKTPNEIIAMVSDFLIAAVVVSIL